MHYETGDKLMWLGIWIAIGLSIFVLGATSHHLDCIKYMLRIGYGSCEPEPP